MSPGLFFGSFLLFDGECLDITAAALDIECHGMSFELMPGRESVAAARVIIVALNFERIFSYQSYPVGKGYSSTELYYPDGVI